VNYMDVLITVIFSLLSVTELEKNPGHMTIDSVIAQSLSN